MQLRDYQEAFFSETWIDIPGWEGLYQVSNMGKIKSIGRIVPTATGSQYVHERILKSDVVKGYHRVTLSYKGSTCRKFVHVLVAESFVENPDKKPRVNHKFGDKNDNRAISLEWCTNSENELHSYSVLGKISPESKLVLDLQTGIYYASGHQAAFAKCIKPKLFLRNSMGRIGINLQ